MGDTGQVYLVGFDHLLRTDFFVNKEKFKDRSVGNVGGSKRRRVVERTVEDAPLFSPRTPPGEAPEQEGPLRPQGWSLLTAPPGMIGVGRRAPTTLRTTTTAGGGGDERAPSKCARRDYSAHLSPILKTLAGRSQFF